MVWDQKTERNKKHCANWSLSNHAAEVASQADNKDLAYYSIEFLAKWISRGEDASPSVHLSVSEGLVVSTLGTAARTYSSKLLEASWSVLKWSLRKKTPNPESYIAKITAHASQGNLPKAFAALRELEITYGTSDEDLFSPFTLLNPLVVACSEKGFVTLDEVFFFYSISSIWRVPCFPPLFSLKNTCVLYIFKTRCCKSQYYIKALHMQITFLDLN